MLACARVGAVAGRDHSGSTRERKRRGVQRPASPSGGALQTQRGLSGRGTRTSKRARAGHLPPLPTTGQRSRRGSSPSRGRHKKNRWRMARTTAMHASRIHGNHTSSKLIIVARLSAPHVPRAVVMLTSSSIAAKPTQRPKENSLASSSMVLACLLAPQTKQSLRHVIVHTHTN